MSAHTIAAPAAVHQHLLPEGWASPRGYAHGVSARGRTLFLGGQIGWDSQERLQDGFVPQCRQALQNILALLEAGAAGPQHLVRLTWYVTDIATYAGSLRELGQVYREVLGRHYPPMALVQVVRLVEPAALVEIEATAVLPD